MKELLIDATVENLDQVMDFVNAELEAVECAMKLQTQINVAVEEVFVNIASYAYSSELGKVQLRLDVADGFVLEFSDWGKPYNPLDKEDPDIAIPLEEREIGGLGILMVKKMMDAVEYDYRDSMNILTLRKQIA